MPTLADLLSRDRLLLDLRVGSKRELFQELAAAVEAATGVDQTVALAALVQREKLGTTGIGDGLALPHARLPGLAKPLAFFARLARPVDYDALDERPVDLALALVAPEEGQRGAAEGPGPARAPAPRPGPDRPAAARGRPGPRLRPPHRPGGGTGVSGPAPDAVGRLGGQARLSRRLAKRGVPAPAGGAGRLAR